MAATTDLAAWSTTYAVGEGASVRLIGDDRQLGPGRRRRRPARPRPPVRRHHPQRGPTLRRPRRGSSHPRDPRRRPRRLGLLHRPRTHPRRQPPTCADQAFRAWAADTAAGKDTILLAPTRDLVAELNDPRPTPPPPSDTSKHDPSSTVSSRSRHELALDDGTHASAGDVVVTRHNDRHLRYRRHRLGQERRPLDHQARPPRRHLTLRHRTPAHRPSHEYVRRRTCSSGTPPPSTAPKDSPSTPRTPSSPATKTDASSTSPPPAAATATTSTWPPPATETRTPSSGPRHTARRPRSTSPVQSSPATASPVSATTPPTDRTTPTRSCASAAARYLDALTTAAHTSSATTWTCRPGSEPTVSAATSPLLLPGRRCTRGSRCTIKTRTPDPQSPAPPSAAAPRAARRRHRRRRGPRGQDRAHATANLPARARCPGSPNPAAPRPPPSLGPLPRRPRRPRRDAGATDHRQQQPGPARPTQLGTAARRRRHTASPAARSRSGEPSTRSPTITHASPAAA